MGVLYDLSIKIHENAVAHGWWEGDRNFGESIALCHAELSEALEEARAGRTETWYQCYSSFARKERCGIVVCDAADNECGNKRMGRTSAECRFRGCKPEGVFVELADCVIRILDLCAYYGVDLEDVIDQKMEYNTTRPYKHGKAF